MLFMGVRARLSLGSSSGEAGSMKSNSGYDAKVESGTLGQFGSLSVFAARRTSSRVSVSPWAWLSSFNLPVSQRKLGKPYP